MLSEAMKAEGWIEWTGGPCPVPLDSKPGVMFDTGLDYPPGWKPAGMWISEEYGFDCWAWETSGNAPPRRIIAYKPEATHD